MVTSLCPRPPHRGKEEAILCTILFLSHMASHVTAMQITPNYICLSLASITPTSKIPKKAIPGTHLSQYIQWFCLTSTTAEHSEIPVQTVLCPLWFPDGGSNYFTLYEQGHSYLSSTTSLGLISSERTSSHNTSITLTSTCRALSICLTEQI